MFLVKRDYYYRNFFQAMSSTDAGATRIGEDHSTKFSEDLRDAISLDRRSHLNTPWIILFDELSFIDKANSNFLKLYNFFKY